MNNVTKKILGGFAVTAGLFAVLAYAHYKETDTSSVIQKEDPEEKTVMFPLAPLETTTTKADKRIQIVFALDATGSMTGLIGAAKEKIWSIASSFSQADSTNIEMGLVFYRDRGDAFVTKRIRLSADLDSVYEQLMAISAEGGGDGPESVNQGLHEAITKMQWYKDTNTFKSVFLVGDYPPHMDYDNDVKYPTSCNLAKEKDIVINTILMGDEMEAKLIWEKIAQCAGGDFMQVDMNANNLAMNTPYDEKIAELSSSMDDTRLYYGTEEEKMKQVEKKTQSTKLKSTISAATAARRAEYNNTTKTGKSAYLGKKELLNDYKEGKLNLTTMKKEELPDEINRLTEPERKIYLDQKLKQRDSLEANLKQLISQRKEYVEKELNKKNKEEVEKSLDYTIYENVKKQAAKKKINMKGKAKI